MSDEDQVFSSIHKFFDGCINDYLALAAKKNLSPIYNANWEADGELLSSLEYMKNYISQQGISSISNLQILQEPGVTPALFFTAYNSIPSEDYTVLFYSHIDKFPFGDGWSRFQPETPGVSDGYIYGRGTANSLYAIFVILSFLKACQEIPLQRPDIAVLIESSFESGSKDLNRNLEKLSGNLNNVKQIICLDTWSPTKENFHYMKSSRGSISFNLKITTGTETVHSGVKGGLIPDPIMILNNLLSNKLETIEKSEDGLATNIKLPLLECDITEAEKLECQKVIEVCSFKLVNLFPYEGISYLIGSKDQDYNEDYITAYINGVLRPSYSILGFEDMPDIENASGTIKPNVDVRLCFRTPPTLDVNEGLNNLKELFTTNPPFGAKIEIYNEEVCPGVDLEKSNNLITEKMIKSFDSFCNKMNRDNSLAIRMGRSFPGLYYLTQKFPNIPIFVTGCGNTFTDKIRDADECTSIVRLIAYAATLTYYACDYKNYIQKN